jgi:L-alanine-DL-glutamate epimerase-like enolase superfamily enzyme
MVSIKSARTAIRASEAIRAVAEANGAPIVVGSQGDSALGAYVNASFAAAHRTTSALPAELLFHRLLSDDLVVDRFEVAGGVAVVPDTPGFGYEVDEAKVTRYRL